MHNETRHKTLLCNFFCFTESVDDMLLCIDQRPIVRHFFGFFFVHGMTKTKLLYIYIYIYKILREPVCRPSILTTGIYLCGV